VVPARDVYAFTLDVIRPLLLNSRHNSRSIELKWYAVRCRGRLVALLSLLNSVAICVRERFADTTREGLYPVEYLSRELCSQPSKVNASR